MTANLSIYNTLSGKKEIFKALHAGKVGMYVCGPTLYNYVHLGNCRTFIAFDMIRRYFIHLGYQVRFVRNLTDVGHLENDADEGEDKISKKARLEQLEPMEIVQNYTLYFHEAMRKLNVIPPNIEPTATGHLLEQIAMIQAILNKGYAYEVNGSVYFDVKKYNQHHHYGILSGRKIEELLENTRDLKNTSEKRDAADFALWKKAAPEHIMHWASPWSEGFPGWHIECSSMSSKYLGHTFDIHGGGMDLKFPHHECEIAQGVASHNVEPAKYWMHSNMFTVNGQKMSKSANNFLVADQLFNGNSFLQKAYSPPVVRLFMLHAHYRSVLDFSKTSLDAIEVIYKKISRSYLAFQEVPITETAETAHLLQALFDQCYAAMNDDFNTVLLLTYLQELSKWMNIVSEQKKPIHPEDKRKTIEHFKTFFIDILGLEFTETVVENKGQSGMDILLKLRTDAKQEKDFKLADKIREELKAKGFAISDTPEGPKIEPLK
jgi:cysteinyl-tRNA synthetase